ncbi:uncharacterized protein LOC134815898 isoform X2 [Bolinopsis microptera]|uniref:uncharacterized protein LOC134815898 isoform X2 n=1 Tax=Bolinopsis microptera TaxID=2820187 RepID=UPI00307AA864
MEEDPFHHEKLANTLVKQTLTVAAVEKNRLSKEGGTLESEELKTALDKLNVSVGNGEEVIEEIIPHHESAQKRNLTNDSECLLDSLGENDRSVSEESSEKSSKSSSSSSTSSSSSSSPSSASLKQTKPTRLAQTFKKGDLVHELNKTRVLDKSAGPKRDAIPIIKKADIKAKKAAPRVNSWIDPKSVRGTPHDKQKIKDWVTYKDEQKRKHQQQVKKEEQDVIEREREEYEIKDQLQKKNFQQWQSNKKNLLEQKMKHSLELKARKKEKQLEEIEKLEYSEKAFRSWKSRKEEKSREENKVKKLWELGKKEEDNKLRIEKERDQKKSFEMWCQAQTKEDEKKREAQRKAKEAETELEILQEYRKQDSEEEYFQWKKEKSLNRSLSPKPAEHRLGWAPAGKSDGRHRSSSFVGPTSPNEPLSKTLATLQDGPSYHRKLKTVDVCCRKISFWCHCHIEHEVHVSNGFHDENFRQIRSQPTRSSTPKTSPRFSRLEPEYYEYERSNGFESPMQLSRHTTPVNSRPSTPRHGP